MRYGTFLCVTTARDQKSLPAHPNRTNSLKNEHFHDLKPTPGITAPNRRSGEAVSVKTGRGRGKGKEPHFSERIHGGWGEFYFGGDGFPEHYLHHYEYLPYLHV